MNGLCDQFLACPTLSSDQDGGVGRRDTSHGAQHLHQRMGTADNPIEMELLVGLSTI